MIVVGTTLASFAMSIEDRWSSWLANAEAMVQSVEEPVQFFAAIETDARGVEPFQPLLQRLKEIGGEYWTFSLDDGRESISTANRLRHITMGQNLVVDYCTAPGVSHLLFMAADCRPPADALPKLLEVDHGLVGGHVGTYCLRGAEVPHLAHLQVQEHMATAAFVLIRRDVFKRLRWRWDAEDGLSDDPAYHKDAIELLGMPTYVRHDCIGQHYPVTIGPVETRYTKEAMKVIR